MFKKITKTKYPPSSPILVWDGECKFCKWWKTRWELRTKNDLSFKTYQEVAAQFPDIPEKEFKKASRLIEIDGCVYSGSDSAYRSLYIAGDDKWHIWYAKEGWFQKISDLGYNHIAKNRNFYYKTTIVLFGKDPEKPAFYWMYYLLLFMFIFLFLIL